MYMLGSCCFFLVRQRANSKIYYFLAMTQATDSKWYARKSVSSCLFHLLSCIYESRKLDRADCVLVVRQVVCGMCDSVNVHNNRSNPIVQTVAHSLSTIVSYYNNCGWSPKMKTVWHQQTQRIYGRSVVAVCKSTGWCWRCVDALLIFGRSFFPPLTVTMPMTTE